MDKLISKDALLKVLLGVDDEYPWPLYLGEAIAIVENAPVIEDVAPVVNAKTIGYGDDLHRCSKCGHLLPYDVNGDAIDYWKCNYCPNCGAKMDSQNQESK